MIPHGPFGQVLKGVAVSLRSYSRPLRAPKNTFLVSVKPDVAWWDFHRSPQAFASGAAAMNELLAAGHLADAALDTAHHSEARFAGTALVGVHRAPPRTEPYAPMQAVSLEEVEMPSNDGRVA